MITDFQKWKFVNEEHEEPQYNTDEEVSNTEENPKSYDVDELIKNFDVRLSDVRYLTKKDKYQYYGKINLSDKYFDLIDIEKDDALKIINALNLKEVEGFEFSDENSYVKYMSEEQIQEVIKSLGDVYERRKQEIEMLEELNDTVIKTLANYKNASTNKTQEHGTIDSE